MTPRELYEARKELKKVLGARPNMMKHTEFDNEWVLEGQTYEVVTIWTAIEEAFEEATVGPTTITKEQIGEYMPTKNIYYWYRRV